MLTECYECGLYFFLSSTITAVSLRGLLEFTSMSSH